MATRPELESVHYDHQFLGPSHDANEGKTRAVVALTIVMMIGEIAAGWFTGSMALLADGFHMATHAGALLVALAAYRFARVHARNPLYSFGTGKVGDLAGFASALVLGIVSIGIAFESAARLFAPAPIIFRDAILVAVLGLVVNIVSAVLLSGGHGHAHGHDHGHGHTHDHDHAHSQDNNLRAAYVHVLADAVTSIAAIIALVAGQQLGWLWMDPLIGIAGSIIIARWAWTLMRDTAAILLDQSDPALVAKVRARVEADDARIVDLHVWQVGPGAHAAIVSVVGTASCNELRERLAGLDTLRHVTIEARLT